MDNTISFFADVEIKLCEEGKSIHFKGGWREPVNPEALKDGHYYVVMIRIGEKENAKSS